MSSSLSMLHGLFKPCLHGDIQIQKVLLRRRDGRDGAIVRHCIGIPPLPFPGAGAHPIDVIEDRTHRVVELLEVPKSGLDNVQHLILAQAPRETNPLASQTGDGHMQTVWYCACWPNAQSKTGAKAMTAMGFLKWVVHLPQNGTIGLTNGLLTTSNGL